MDLRLTFAIFVGKIIALILKISGSGSTAAPGLYALKIDPDLVKKLSKKITNGSTVISGTNGKTTTARLAYDILSTKYRVIHNRQGSNLLRGIASTLIKHSSIFGNLGFETAIWEVDEAVFDKAIENVNPRQVVLLNLFRDQLDRYGEIDSIRKKWAQATLMLPKTSQLILNIDDPGINIIAKSHKGKIINFGINEDKINLPEIKSVADTTRCPNCQSKLTFKMVTSAHMGDYMCTNCGFKRPSPQIFARDLKFKPDFTTSAQLTVNGKQLTVNSSLPGLYNVYNILAASSIAQSANIGPKIIKSCIEKYSSAFGRFQSVQVNGNSVLIFLIKNPVGANEVLRTLALKDNLNLLTILNDNFADGRDVSWIWDTNWEALAAKNKTVSVAGIRAWDMAARLKYAGIKLSKKSIYKEISYSIRAALETLNNKDTLIILPTYTALLEVQRTLHKLGASTKWHEQ